MDINSDIYKDIGLLPNAEWLTVKDLIEYEREEKGF